MMPVVFIGHGSPMNVIEQNPYAPAWRAIAQPLPRPKAILSVSAHWYTRGGYVSSSEKPETIHDFYGFPQELYDITYPAPGAPGLAARAAQLAGPGLHPIAHGLDHGTWSVLRFMYPEADIPVVQFSVDGSAGPRQAFDTGRRLAALRREGVLILGSGNVVHNLLLVDFDRPGGFDWAQEFDGYIQSAVRERRFEDVIQYQKAGACARQAFSTPDHFLPLLYVLGAVEESDESAVYCADCVLGALSMTSYVFGQ